MQSPVKLVAKKFHMPLYQPGRINDRAFIEALKTINPDLFVVASFGQLLPKSILDIPRMYAINVHPSLLPKYRGAAPVAWTLLAGEKRTGVTIFRMTEKMDDGNVIAQREVAVEDTDTALDLNERLSKIGGELLVEAVSHIEEGSAQLVQQDSGQATYARKLKKEDGRIDWNRTSTEIHNHIRGMVPWPSAYTSLGTKNIKIWEAKPYECTIGDNAAAAPGTILAIGSNGISVKTKDGALLICTLQAPGGKKMSAVAYCRGHKTGVGQRFL
jgi:methionyl-tRNA formyltransferase